jgi:hypothetical protein
MGFNSWNDLILWWTIGYTGILFVFPLNNFQKGKFTNSTFAAIQFILFVVVVWGLMGVTGNAMKYISLMLLALTMCLCSFRIVYFDRETNPIIRKKIDLSELKV